MTESDLSVTAIENQFALVENIKANMLETYMFLGGKIEYNAWLQTSAQLKTEQPSHILHLQLIALLIKADSQMREKLIKKEIGTPQHKKKKFWLF